MAYSGLSLDGRVAVVIGGTTGIGRALALGLAEAGADVVATSRRIEQVEDTAAALEAKGRRTLRVTSDVSNRSTLEAVLAKTLEKLGKVDILVNSAGAIKRVPTLEMEDSTWNSIIETNLTGTLRSCQVFGRHMLERGYGRIINIASLNSFVAFHEITAYSASKAGVMGLTRSLAVEWGPRGVIVNAIAPGVFRTALNQQLLDGTDRGRELLMRTPLKRFGKLEELVGPTIFFASESAAFVNGQTLAVDGGFVASGVNQ
ncbi:MAG TPA: SDR family oxidoreductase [Polyangiaceae bacterium]|jgi:NAD(P)-dependent dehydrogenase (short-subunit alcohol dehydrogenase family)|nr:SDR family oxidoreductase [Polyangiaceae bacterium]